jgi:hypothetical protein
MQQQQQQQQLQIEQQKIQMQQMIAQHQEEMQYRMHQEDLENKIVVANINSEAEKLRMAILNHDNDEANTLEREKIAENARQFDATLKQNDKKIEIERQKQKDDARLKEKQINKAAAKKS